MSLLHILAGTPTWVWILFVFLFLRGFKALEDREIKINRLFLLPLLFLIWGIYSVMTEIGLPFIGLFSMLFGLALGYGIGWLVWRKTPRLIKKQNSDLIIRVGSPLTLLFILFAFFIKFFLISYLNTNPELTSNFAFNLIFGLLSGIIDGVFWGGTLNLYFTSKLNSH